MLLLQAVERIAREDAETAYRNAREAENQMRG